MSGKKQAGEVRTLDGVRMTGVTDPAAALDAAKAHAARPVFVGVDHARPGSDRTVYWDAAMASKNATARQGGKGDCPPAAKGEPASPEARTDGADAPEDRESKIDMALALSDARAKRMSARRAEAVSIRKARPDSPERRAARTRRIRDSAPRDGFARMVDAGRIDERLAAAGWDLIRVLEAAEAGAMCMPDPDALKTGAIRVTGRKGAPQFAAIEGYADRYVPFVKALSEPGRRMGPKGKDGKGRYPASMALDVVISVVVNGEGMKAVEARLRLRHGTAGGLLSEALEIYARRMR